MHISRSVLLVALLVAAGTAGAAQPVGETQFARGAVSAQAEGQTPRLLGRGSPIHVGEVLTTGPKSLATLKLADGTRMVLRPRTVFKVEALRTEPRHESALMRLFKGGLRAISGFLSKRNPDAVRIHTPVATIGIRGTELDVRLCTAQDCAEEAAAQPVSVGHVGYVRGTATATGRTGAARRLSAGGPLFEGDEVTTPAGAFVVMVFRDRGRITLAGDSRFRVERFRYEPKRPERGRSLFSLLKGGLRAITGLIGRHHARGYRLRTPVATIGIRGTAFDLLCQGSCVSPPGVTGTDQDGLWAQVSQGTIDFDGQHPLGPGQGLFLSNMANPAVPVPGLPRPLGVPRPNEVQAVPPSQPQGTRPQPGLYVACHQGECAVRTGENVVELEAGGAGFVGVGGGPAQRLPGIPTFQLNDPYLQAVDPRLQNLMNLLNPPGGQGDFQCRVP